MGKREWKIVARAFIIFGAIATVFGWMFGSEKVVFHESKFGDSMEFIGQLLLVTASVFYVILDIPNLKERLKNILSLMKK